MPQYRGLVRTLHKTVTVTSVSVTGLRSSRTRANKLVSIVSRFFWLVLSNLISLSRSWERKARSTLARIVPWIVHVRDESPTGAVACVASVSVWFRNKKRTRNDEELDFRSSPGEKWDESQKWKKRGEEVSSLSSPPPPRSFTRHIFRAVFDTLSLFFAPKRHGNACYADYRARAGRRLVSGSEDFAVYGSLLIMSLRGVWLVRHVLIIISYTVCAAIKGMIFYSFWCHALHPLFIHIQILQTDILKFP